MDPKAVKKAKERLVLATGKLDEARSAPDYAAFAGAWYFFLIAAKNVYTTLEQGAKASPQSRQWFGSKKNERKNDPLLQYLFQARDDDEHGLADITTMKPSLVEVGRAVDGYSRSFSISASGDSAGKVTIHELQSHDGLPVLIEETPSHAILLPVVGRGPVIYHPPKTHRGVDLPDSLPLTVGSAALRYLEDLISDAAARTT